jgi:putative DNA primase/helicase
VTIPEELRSRRQWVVWRAEQRDGKPTKVPYRARDPRVRASTTDARTWGSFDQAAAAVESGRAEGPGFVFDGLDPYTGVDLDECRDPETGEAHPTAAAIIGELDSYSEASPSGAGVHVIVRAQLGGGRCRRGPVELYDQGRYFTMSGERLLGTPAAVMSRQREVDALRARLFPPAERVTRIRLQRPFAADDEELLRSAFAARNGSDVERLYRGDASGYASPSEADLALCSHLAFWTGGDAARVDALFRSSGLMRDKWERPDYRERTLAVALGERG